MADPKLGVIVDKSSFDEDDELGSLGFGNDIHSIGFEEDRSVGNNDGGVLMKNGKVRRKLRWKPPTFRRKKNNVSSNMSVISALTNRSSSTNRSISTTRSTKSFISIFSRKSQNSFHSFGSTATPVMTNKANSPQFPHAVQRPNYPDTFDAKHATIDNEGRQASFRNGSDLVLETVSEVDIVLETVSEVDIVERSSTLPGRLGASYFDPYGGRTSSASDAVDTMDTEPKRGVPTAIKQGASPEKTKKSKRPPLFKRKLKKTKMRPPSPASTSQESSTSSAASSGSPLSRAASLERENSFLPMLELENYEEDRRIALCVGTPRRSKLDFSDETDNVDDTTTQGNAPSIPTSSTGTEKNNSATLPRVSTPENSMLTPTTDPHPSPPVVKSTQSTSPTNRPSPNKPYNRPIDSTVTAEDSAVTEDENTKEVGSASPTSRSPTKHPTVPVDPEGNYLEADHNLRAIHNMAAEHMKHGEYEEAIEVFEEILKGQQERYGQDHYRVGTALHNLGIVYLKSGDFDKAIEICSKAVNVRKESLVPNHPDVAVSLAQLGVAYLESQQYEDSLVAFREALHIRRTFLGSRHPKCAKILNNIGCSQYSMDDLEGSRLTFEEALAIQREALGNIQTPEDALDPPTTQSNTILLSLASTLCNIGSIRLRLGQFEEAEIALEEALLVRYFPFDVMYANGVNEFLTEFTFSPQIQQSVLGDDHPMVASTIESLELVENAEKSVFPSANDFLGKWSGTIENEELDTNNTMMCTAKPNIEDMLNLGVFNSLSPRKWFTQGDNSTQSWLSRMGEAITEKSCGETCQADVVEDALEQAKSYDYSISGRFSV